jgi:CheY-like chemotaxis protein
LVLGGKVTATHPIAQCLGQFFQVDVHERLDDALTALREQTYHAVFADAGDFLPLERGLVGEKASLVLNTIGEGVCVVDADGRCSWSNNRFRSFAPEVVENVRKICRQAQRIFTTQTSPATDSAHPRSKKFTFQVGERYFELITSPVIGAHPAPAPAPGSTPGSAPGSSSNTNGAGTAAFSPISAVTPQVVAVVWDATSGKRLQTKIDAIDAAGRELARLESDAVAKLTPSERLKLLQEKIIKYSKDLMHFDHFTIRLLDKRTNKLEVVIAEGLPPEALDIDLYAQPEGNGISGYVAATGRSYICHDVEKDPRYVLGLQHSKSSLTVPLALFDKVIGVYNIESCEVGAFDEDDRQFAEIFGRYVGLALHILDLLVVERCTTSGQITDNVVQEMAQPLNDIVTEAQTLMEEYIGDDTMRSRLNKIADYVEMIRTAIRDVAAGPKSVLGKDDENPRREQDPVLVHKRILIADDEANIRRTIADVLAARGCQCFTAKDGYEAVALLEQQSFDLVLSDIKMPYRNGYEIFAAARRQNEKLPVLLMTGFGYDPHHSIVRASQEGLATVLFKPFKVEQLIAEVHKALAAAPAAANAGPIDKDA